MTHPVAVEEHYSLSVAHVTMDAAKNEATRAADRYQRSALARVSPPTSSQERKRLVDIMPATPDNAPPCPEPHVDGCPNCVLNAEEPVLWIPNDQGGCACIYRCSDCGFEWPTNYSGCGR